MANYSSSDKNLLRSAFNELLQVYGIRENSFPSLLDDLLNTTDSPMTLYVDVATGNDSNTGTQKDPFLTIQAAVNSLPKRIRHQVDIRIATGNYAGFTVQGFTVDSADDVSALPCGIRFIGTQFTATVATGTATGAFTSVTAGVATTATFAVLTDSTQSWTVDDLRGKWVEILTGTSAGNAYPIQFNTATALTVTVGSAVGSIGGTYAIRDCTTIVSPAPFPVNLPTSIASVPAPQPGGINIQNNNTGQITTNRYLLFEWLRVAPTTGFNGIRCLNSSATFSKVASAPSGASSTSWLFGGSQDTSCLSCISLTGPSGNVGITLFSGAPSIAFNLGLVYAAANVAGTGISIVSTVPARITCAQTSIERHAFGITVAGCGARLSLSGARVTTNNQSQGIRSRIVSSGFSGLILDAVGLDISNCGTALELSGGHEAYITTLSGTGNTTAIDLSRNARLQLGSGSTITGTGEIVLDSAAAVTIASMRAASPKLLTNTYGTIIFE